MRPVLIMRYSILILMYIRYNAHVSGIAVTLGGTRLFGVVGTSSAARTGHQDSCMCGDKIGEL